MNKAEARESIYRELTPLFPGFRLKKSDEGFVRAIPGGTDKVLVPLIDYNPIFIFSLIMGIRNEEVERIFNLFSGSPPKYHAMTLTTMTPLDFFYPGQREKKEFKVSTPEEIRNAARELSKTNNAIIDFFNQHQDVKSLDASINSGAAGFDQSSHPYRAMHAIILAHLANNPNFESLVSGFQEEARQWHEADRNKFDRLVSYLRGHSTAKDGPT
jgi:hypothetical protein